MTEQTIAPKTVNIPVPQGQDPKDFAAKAAKLIQKSEKDSERRARYNEARNAAHAVLISKHPQEWETILTAEKVKRGINPNSK